MEQSEATNANKIPKMRNQHQVIAVVMAKSTPVKEIKTLKKIKHFWCCKTKCF